MKADVLISGAGPTGLVLALWLTSYNVSVRIIDKQPGPGNTSRAMAVHARTLEFYQQMGLADEVIERGIKVEHAQIHSEKGVRGDIHVGDIGQKLSPYPYVVSFAQDEHEELLIRHLQQKGVDVEWNTELVHFIDSGEDVVATVQLDGHTDRIEASYLCGCDGAHSAVRKGLAFAFPGGTYERPFFVADVEATGKAIDGGMDAYLYKKGLLLMLPVRTAKTQRLLGILPEEFRGEDGGQHPQFQSFVEDLCQIQIQCVNWYSEYRVHHRVTEQFQKGRVFIAGDAAHIHSPAGGQGMNTGIGDAVNLAWKLAAAIHKRADVSILQTYETERIDFAKTLVATTDRAFSTVMMQNVFGRTIRNFIAPKLAPLLFKWPFVREIAFHTVSQIGISYRSSVLSEGAVGKRKSGDRLPWTGDNFSHLQSIDWQIHVYGNCTPALTEKAATLNIPIHTMPWTDKARQAGLRKDALYLVRPDSHIALASKTQDVQKLQHYVTTHRLERLL
ncbi:FAD-dependent monooxygenase [Aureibacillus halotolerans]|nr:FAD-dependent monooxygenase [Aureibacillus halotolerans]